MKHLKMFMAGFVALSMGLTACSSEEIEDPTTPTNPGGEAVEGSKDVVYSSIRFNLPKGRSTESEGNEVGQDYENQIGSILVVLATAEGEGTSATYTYVTHALSDASVSAPGNDKTKHTIVFQDKKKMLTLADKNAYVFAYCNPTEEIRNFFTGTDDKTDFVNKVCSELTSTWTDNGFLMTNVAPLKKEMPSQAEIKTYNTENNALALGSVDVIRTAVRFDYKDGSPKGEDKAPKFGTNTYPIYDSQVLNPTDENVVAKIHMTNVALVNMRNQFYYLPRTSAGGLCPGLTGMETLAANDYVITPEEATFSLAMPTKLQHGDAEYNKLQWESLDAIVGGTADIDEGWGTGIADKEGYYIWDYTSENTANGNAITPAATTGVIFEAEIQFTEAPAENGPAYLFGNTIYTSIAAIQEDIKKAPVSNLATAYSKAFTVNADNTVSPKSDEEVEAAGFTIYKPADDGKYYCYYWYFNRHNNDNDPTTTGIMEFATVRNNVYKLSVTGVKKLGTFKPGEIEDWDAYFSLDVDVKPWVVRVNNIEF